VPQRRAQGAGPERHGRTSHPGNAAGGAPPSDDGERAPPEDMRLRLELEIPNDVRYIEHIVGVVQRECQIFDYPARFCALNIPVALSEALSNAILRGNGEDAAKHVAVRVHVDASRLVMEVEDEGTGFDLDASTRDPAAPQNLEREDGRGLFLMRALMDRVERFQDGGNVVRLTLRRT
jgi:serine/threonine-protein kinase RsbW